LAGDVAQGGGHRCGQRFDPSGLRSAEARNHADLITAIGQALARVTPQDALNWFAHCRYSFC